MAGGGLAPRAGGREPVVLSTEETAMVREALVTCSRMLAWVKDHGGETGKHVAWFTLEQLGMPAADRPVKPDQAALVRAAVTATVVYCIVKLPPIASMAAPTASSTSASLSGGRWVRAPEVGS